MQQGSSDAVHVTLDARADMHKPYLTRFFEQVLSDLVVVGFAPRPHREQDGYTALILSSTSGRLDVVRLLLGSRADIQAVTKVPLLYNPMVAI
jgi:ankyrin repeat protein